VGVGAVLPDALSAPAFWRNVREGRCSITEVPDDRWRVGDYYDPDPKAPDKTYSKIGGWVRGFELDWRRFRLPPRVTARMDASQQWALGAAAEALADYGFPERPLDTDRTGVVLGTAMGGERHLDSHLRISHPEYLRLLEATAGFRALGPAEQAQLRREWRAEVDAAFAPITEDTMPGELANVVSGRVANVLDLRGPNFITDAACASSLAAVTAATKLLLEHHCDAVLTGGVDHNMAASNFVKFCKVGALSARGSCPFGADADGFVMGEGCAVLLLRRLEDAGSASRVMAGARASLRPTPWARRSPSSARGATPASIPRPPPSSRRTAPAPSWAIAWSSRPWPRHSPPPRREASRSARSRGTSAT
jgi:acyl transferase domain-containing protein